MFLLKFTTRKELETNEWEHYKIKPEKPQYSVRLKKQQKCRFTTLLKSRIYSLLFLLFIIFIMFISLRAYNQLNIKTKMDKNTVSSK